MKKDTPLIAGCKRAMMRLKDKKSCHIGRFTFALGFVFYSDWLFPGRLCLPKMEGLQ